MTHPLSPIFLATAAVALLFTTGPQVALHAQEEGKFPPPPQIAGKWTDLFAGKLEDNWTGMSMSLQSPLITTAPNPDKPGQYVLKIARGPTGLIRSRKVLENFIMELEWRHMTEAPSANGGNGTSGNSGILVCHSAFPNIGGPYPAEGHEVQVCHLGNGSWYTSHGDLFTLPGTNSQAIPDPRFAESHSCGHRSMPIQFLGSKTGEWNKVRLTCVDGVLQQEINGTLVTSLYRISPRKGYMSFESEGAPVEFRNLRVQELKPDPDLVPRHIAPLLPEDMTTDYITDRKPMQLPAGNCILSADLRGTVPLNGVFSGVTLPAEPVSGRVILTIRDAKATVVSGKKELASVAADAAVTVHLDNAEAKFGHVLLFKPAGKP